MKRFTQGERVKNFPGGTWNQLIDAAQEFRASREGSTAGSGSGGAERVVAQVRNLAGAIAQGTAVGLSGAIESIPADAGADPLAAALPAAAQGTRHATGGPHDGTQATWGIALRPIAAGDVGPVLLVGIAAAWVDVTDELATSCGPDGAGDLVTGRRGATILAMGRAAEADPLGVQVCLVVLGSQATEASVAGLYGLVTTEAPAGSRGFGDALTPGEGAASLYEADSDGLLTLASGSVDILNPSTEVDLVVDAVVRLLAVTVDDATLYYAEYLEIADYLRALSGAGKVLYRSDAAGDPIEWQSEACP